MHSQGPRHVRYAPKPKRSRRPQVVGVLALLALLAWCSSNGGGPTPPGTEVEALPPSVQGTWRSSDARYADRGIQITETLVVIMRGADGPPVSGRLTGIRSWKEGGQDVVLLEYVTEEGEEELEMHLETPTRMRLRNPSDVVWTRN